MTYRFIRQFLPCALGSIPIEPIAHLTRHFFLSKNEANWCSKYVSRIVWPKSVYTLSSWLLRRPERDMNKPRSHAAKRRKNLEMVSAVRNADYILHKNSVPFISFPFVFRISVRIRFTLFFRFSLCVALLITRFCDAFLGAFGRSAETGHAARLQGIHLACKGI